MIVTLTSSLAAPLLFPSHSHVFSFFYLAGRSGLSIIRLTPSLPVIIDLTPQTRRARTIRLVGLEVDLVQRHRRRNACDKILALSNEVVLQASVGQKKINTSPPPPPTAALANRNDKEACHPYQVGVLRGVPAEALQTIHAQCTVFQRSPPVSLSRNQTHPRKAITNVTLDEMELELTMVPSVMDTKAPTICRPQAHFQLSFPQLCRNDL
ncbi:hypothetical protein EV421DRAFT_1765818 [Armillaria borealis]|uniref:Uncharacterized protein n=1 Tax=Armillaria borealis TaxID=47425 RepID=A0AA39K378_9AGAR|nr:hypothetical protein EV421DRAFT_1765818 [Armillaria borealis]